MRNKLRQVRLFYGFTQEELAEASGIARSTLVKYEKNPDAEISGEVRWKICEALGCAHNEVFIGAERRCDYCGRNSIYVDELKPYVFICPSCRKALINQMLHLMKVMLTPESMNKSITKAALRKLVL